MKELLEVAGIFAVLLTALILTVCYSCCVVGGQCSREEEQRTHNQPHVHSRSPVVHPRGPVKK
jgi:hypothetical protein